MEFNSRLFCPYVGLTPYTEDEAEYFFGREKETHLITTKLFSSRLTVLYGPGGSGKSSLLRAGVAHTLRQEENAVVYFSAWQSDPLVGLCVAIAGEVRRILETRGAIDIFLKSPFAETFQFTTMSLSDYLRLAAEQVGPLLILLDQFEEYFLYHPSDEGKLSFATELTKAVNRDDVLASFLISIREDAYTKLDRFKGRIPNLFGNYTRLEHLTRYAARSAIEKPIEQFNRHATLDEPIHVEPALIEAVLDQVQTGRVIMSEAGRGTLPSADETAQIETPFLQLVMTRLWDETIRGESRVLRIEMLMHLGGAERIVRTHLDNVMTKMSADEQETSARIFRYLVTPSGTKIAHTTEDLVSYTDRNTPEVERVLKTLMEDRVLRAIAPPPDNPTATRYEIFHGVLAPSVLDWQRRHIEKQARERLARERRRTVLLTIGLIGSFLLLLVATIIIIFYRM